jgi:hypothetical protein
VVSQQYLVHCKNNGYDVKDIQVGRRLEVNPDYFRNAVHVIYEIGAKLCFVLWRKFDKQGADLAEKELNELSFALISKRQYSLAEILLTFGVEVIRQRKGLDRTRIMMVVNLANAVRLQKQKERAKTILSKEDWDLR